MSDKDLLIQLKSVDHPNMSDLSVLLSDCTPESLREYFENVTKPGEIDQVSLEEFLLNLPRESYKQFGHFRMLMTQREYDFNDTCIVVKALKRIFARNRQTVFDGLKKKVYLSEKEDAYWAEVLMYNAWQLLLSMLQEPMILRGSERDPITGLQYPSARGQSDESVNRDEILEEALHDLGRRA